MRVTFVLPTLDYSGGNRVVSVHAAGLIALGHEVNVVVPGPPQRRLRDSIADIVRRHSGAHSGSGLFARHGSHVTDAGIVPLVAQTPGAVRADDMPDADVVIATWWETAEWVLALPSTKGAKVYFVQGYEVFAYTPKQRVEATYRAPLRRITISHWLRDKLTRDFNDNDVDLVPNGVDTSHFSCAPRARQLAPTVGFIASTTPVKGLDTAIAALAELRAHLPKLRVLSFGQEDLAPELFGDFAQYTRQPTQAQIRDIYSRCDVWLAPSHSEGFGLPVLEAMACRTPVVSTRTGWADQGISDGVNGYLAEPGAVAALAQHLATVLSLDGAAWSRMSNAAHQTALALDWSKSTALFEASLRRSLAATSKSQNSVTSTVPA